MLSGLVRGQSVLFVLSHSTLHETKTCVPMPLYLHFLSYALAAEVLGFVEVVCSEAAC